MARDNEPGVTYRPKRVTEPLTVPESIEKAETPRSPSSKHPVIVKPATYDGSTSWLDYKSHFEACAALGRWNEQEQALYLAVSLRGQTQAVIGNLPTGTPKSCEALVNALNERFAPPNQTELYRAQLKERRQKVSETLPDLGQGIRRLVNLAYPTAPNDLRKILAKEHFIDAFFDSDMRLRIKQARPMKLNDAVRHATELEAFNKAEQKRKEGEDYLRPINEPSTESTETKSELGFLLSKMNKMQEAIAQIQTDMKSPSPQGSRLSTSTHDSRNGQKTLKKCYNCGRKGHFQRDCRMQGNKGTRKEQNGNKPNKSRMLHNARSGVNKQNGDAGLFIEAKVSGQPLKLLTDTGATVSIVSESAYEHICKADRDQHTLSRVKRSILLANDEPLRVHG